MLCACVFICFKGVGKSQRNGIQMMALGLSCIPYVSLQARLLASAAAAAVPPVHLVQLESHLMQMLT